ncbi:tetratricopeptide repeat-containing serine protease family protein [Pleurocapsa sp. PCC 7319]|uniref:tetratricopeptide repeat-containing S1 family peptidase n=1 Tax=Pleurocapsa sp. PCC 7319 TaxID=118161 RepID=UPI00034A467C|nr:tetratricopeptide repeat-containing serine protease family protein [Pleurocapsa sp. PCC 7319]
MFFNHQLLNSYLATAITGTAAFTLVSFAPSIAIAKSPTEIAAIAEVVTVKIDNNLGVPGGSGVIIAQENNTYTVLTANHVVKNVNIGYIVKTPDHQQYQVTEVRNLEQDGLDLAYVKFNSNQEYSVATIGSSEYATPGASIFVSGYPLAAEIDQERNWEFTTGTITSIRDSASEGYSMRYQALTRRGMSGGGVFDTSGNLVGIHGQGDVIGSVKNESSSIPEPLKTGFNAAIPIQNFTKSLADVGLSDSALTIDQAKPDQEDTDIDVEATKQYAEGLELLAQGDTARANEYLIEAEKKNPNNVVAIYYRGLIDYTKRDLTAAIANYDRAIENNPNFSLAYFSRGLAHYHQGSTQKALEDYNKAIQINPTDPWSYLNRGTVKEDLGDVDGALADYNRAIRIAPDYGKSYHNRGAILYSRRDFKGATADFKKASEIFFREGDTNSYNVAIDSLNKAQKALRNSPSR